MHLAWRLVFAAALSVCILLPLMLINRPKVEKNNHKNIIKKTNKDILPNKTMLPKAASTVEKGLSPPPRNNDEIFVDLKAVNLSLSPLPKEVLKKLEERASALEEKFEVVQDRRIFRRSCPPTEYSISPNSNSKQPGKCVILLSDALGDRAHSFWTLRLNTLQTLCAMGHNAHEVDLPGYGNTKGVASEPITVEFWLDIFEKLCVSPEEGQEQKSRPIVVANGVTGRHLFKMIREGYEGHLCGFVPVNSNAQSTEMSSDQLNAVRLPILIVRGEKGNEVNVGAELKQVPTSSNEHVIRSERFKHPFLDQTDLSHRILVNFLSEIKC